MVSTGKEAGIKNFPVVKKVSGRAANLTKTSDFKSSVSPSTQRFSFGI
jgi:hypothetical protein